MRTIPYLTFLLLLTLIVFRGSSTGLLAQAPSYSVNVTRTFQTIENFGASDCWSARFLGLWPDEKRNDIADLLFSLETDAIGKPKGIGLSLWRFNIGAGSAEQGNDSRITDIYRRTECFLKADGGMDWSKQTGQRWFLQAAKKRGVKQFLAFSNSPPVHLTANHLATNIGRPRDGSMNLPETNYDAWAEFLSDTIAGLALRDGIYFNYLSPFNEPEWNWDGSSQEGTPAKVNEIANMARCLDKQLSIKGLSTRILLTESGDCHFLYQSNTHLSGRDNQIASLFDPESEYYIGNLEHVPKTIAGHGYWTTSPIENMQNTRKELRAALDKYSLNFWQSELCIMDNDSEIGGGGQKDLGMKTALYVARIIHNDLSLGNATAWHWWLAMTPYNYKDGLIYATPEKNRLDGTFTDSKLLWTFGNFSRFIRPGATRVEINPEADTNNPHGLMLSAYIDETRKTVSVVVINYSETEQPIILKTNGFQATAFTPFITSEDPKHNLFPLPKVSPGKTITIPARSVITFVSE